MRAAEDIHSEIAAIETIAQPDHDQSYSRLLAGKRVAIVGPAETMIGTGQGSLIDSHDLIVRFNTVVGYLPFPDDLARDIGAKTDVLYSNNEILLDGIIDQKVVSHTRFVEICEILPLRYIVSTNNGFTYKDSDMASKCYGERERFESFLRSHKIKAGFRMLFATSDMAKKWLRGHTGRTGFIAILDLLSQDINQLYVTGMTFYHSGGHLFLPDRADELDPLTNHRGEKPRDNSLGHNSYLELELMRALSNHFREKLKLDERLQSLLETRRGQ